MMQWFKIAFKNSFFMLKRKEIHKIRKGYIIWSEITVIVYILSCIHPMLKQSANAAVLVIAMQSIMMPPVLKALIQTILGFYATNVWGGVHFISARCRVWINLQLPVFNNWWWVLIFDCVLCLILCICKRVKHVMHIVIQTWCSGMDYWLSTSN